MNWRNQLAALARKVEIVMTDDDGDLQTAQALDVDDDDPIDGVEYYQPYGFASRVVGRGLGLLLALGGARTHSILAAIAHPAKRLRGLQPGEVALYDDQGNFIWLKRETLHVKSTAKVVIEAPDIEITGDTSVTISGSTVTIEAPLEQKGKVEVTGNVTVTGTAEITGDFAVINGTGTINGKTILTA